MFNSTEILTSSGIEAMSAAYQSIQSPQEKGVFSAALVGGAGGAFDAAAQYGMDKLPAGPVNDFATAAVSNLDLTKAPGAIQNVIDGGLSGGLSAAVGDIAGGIDFNNVNVAGLGSQLAGGGFGNVAGLMQNFSNQPGLNSLVPGLPTTASSVLGAAGLGGPWAAAIPAAGLGIQGATALLGGQNPMGAILGGGGAFGSLLGGAGGLFGGGGGNPCPCLPKCRKVDHGAASNGVNPLEAAGALIENNSNKYGSDILNNNATCLAQAAGLDFSGIGESLIPSNILNLTGAISSIPALDDPAGRLEKAIKGGAEQSDLMLEFMYAFEGMEKGLKFADNNISQLEWINHINLVKGLLGYNKIVTGPGSILDLNAADTTEHAQAITDLFAMVQKIDARLYRGSVGVAPTPAILASAANIKEIPAKYAKNKAFLIANVIKDIKQAIDLLMDLDPEFGIAFDLGDSDQKFNQSKVLNDSLSAKISSSAPQEDRVNYTFSAAAGNNSSQNPFRSLSNSQISSGEFDTLISQVNNEQERARKRESDCS